MGYFFLFIYLHLIIGLGILSLMRLTNNIKLGTDMGSNLQLVSSLTNTSLVPTKKDETKMTLINNKMLKGTDWFITPTRNYIKTINGLQATISKRSQYTSRRGNNYKTTYNVTLGDSFLGTRRSFKDAMILAQGGK